MIQANINTLFISELDTHFLPSQDYQAARAQEEARVWEALDNLHLGTFDPVE